MRILLSGGGTAGHINPAVAIARYAMEKDPGTKVLFVGTKKGLESTLVPKEGFDIKYINVSGLQKKLSVDGVVSAAKMAVAVVKSIAIMKKFKPDVVVGTGGYVCVSSVIAANYLKIPTLIHEQNVFPGSAIKFLMTRSSVTATSFEESTKYLTGAKRIELTGNPIRPSILKHTQAECKNTLGLNDKKVVLAFGGSLGANKINDTMVDFLEKFGYLKDMAVFFGTGAREYERVSAMISQKGITLGENINILPYIDNMDVLMNAADVVVCRSGAITLAELCALGKPGILIPSPNVTNNHQEYNARALSDRGAAITITENEFNVDSLSKALFSITENEKVREDMCQKSKAMGITDATDKIYSLIKELTGKQ